MSTARPLRSLGDYARWPYAISSGWNTSERRIYANYYAINPASGVPSPPGIIFLDVAAAVELVLEPGRNFGYVLAPSGAKNIVVPLHSYVPDSGLGWSLIQNSDASGQPCSYSLGQPAARPYSRAKWALSHD